MSAHQPSRWLLTAKTTSLALVLLAASACSGDDESGGDCVSGDSASGVPDMIAAPTFSPATATVGDTVSISIPVDVDTGYVSLNIFSSDRSVSLGGGNATTTGDETVTISFAVEDGILGPVVAGGYFPIINVCADEDACLVTQVGVAYAPEQTTVTGGRFTRVEYEGFNDTSSAQSCYDVELLQVSTP